MATKTDGLTHQLSAILCLLSVNTVSAYYCDNDKCTEEEYCCGDNMCCPSYKVWDLWYFWCGVLFFLFLLSICACLWRYRILSTSGAIVNDYSYTTLKEDGAVRMYPDIAAAGRYVSGSNTIYTPSVRSPPPYSHVSAGSFKIATAPPSYAQIVGVREFN
ncbi:unnamed protein product [Candidula unifasciata]|uniref:Vesicular, overexpressed in cancer, prosurvival protein 1 n=1 Tax=Candidula unifasciata TaxID=100452 RepID=A0A8S3Z2S0_9EUPU|nr:unnamed protein product [Candidula unifasciata]